MTIRRWDDAKKTDNPAMNDTTRIDDTRIARCAR
jgi:hypothetical protein